jgi:carbon storage regulator
MLVLTRKIGERILVPQCQLSVTVLEITASRVRLGVSAPAEVAVHREEVEKRISQEAGLPMGETLMSAHVLIADPDRFLLASYSRHLRERGATVSTATTGLECVERLRDSVPDVLVLEPNLLWGGGDGVLALIAEEPRLKPTVVIVVAQGRDRSLLYRLSSFRVDDYQTKPLTAGGLAQRICTLLSPARDHAVLPG